MNWFVIFWLVALVLLVATELLTVQLVSIWFAAGSLGALLVALLGAPLWVQVLVFVVVSAVSLPLSRPLARRLQMAPKTRTNADAVLGMRGVVTEKIDNLREHGRIMVNGMSWSARGATPDTIPLDTVVRVERIVGVKLIVSPAPLESAPVSREPVAASTAASEPS